MIFSLGHAQTNTVKNVDISSTEDIINKIPRNAVFLFDDFTTGSVYIKHGSTTYAKLNYNTLLNEMQFLDNQNNIMAISNCNDVLLITINNQNFYHISGRTFGQLIFDGDVRLLAIRHTECNVDDSKSGAYGLQSETSSITNIRKDSPVFGQYRSMEVYRNIKYKIVDEYMLEKDGKFFRVKNKNAFIKALPGYKKEIEMYFATNNIEISKESSLIEITKYCNQLIKGK